MENFPSVPSFPSFQFPVQFPNMGQFAPSWCGSQTVRGAPDENLLTLMRAGEMSIYSLPLLKSKRRFRSKNGQGSFRVGVFAGVPSRVLHWQCALHGSPPPQRSYFRDEIFILCCCRCHHILLMDFSCSGRSCEQTEIDTVSRN